MRYRAYLFDVQGTLLDFFTPVTDAVRHHLASLNDAAHETQVDPGEFTRAWRRDYFKRISSLTQTRRNWISVQDLYAAGFGDVCAAMGLPRPDSRTAATVASRWQQLVPWPDVPGGLASLRSQALTAALSNTDMSTMVNLFKQLGIPWDAILTAELFGCFKPDPAVYLGALRFLGVQPSEAAMVACHPYDLRAAAQVGMGTVFVSRPTEYGAPEYAHVDAGEHFGQSVTSIGEIL